MLNYCLALSSGEFTSPSGGTKLDNGDVKSPLRQTTDGYRVTYLPVDRDGLLKLADLIVQKTGARSQKPEVRTHSPMLASGS